MAISTDNPTVSEHDSLSDSDWLDIASTDRDSDDNDSIYSSRETDHEDPSRSRSRRSSLSYGSSRDGDVDAWEGLIEDSADDGMSNDVFACSPHVVSPSQHPPTFDLDRIQDTASEELRVKEGLDQSMISTLSSSRSSSLHSSTVHSATRDLRLSFPDPITSSCRELLGTPPGEIQPDSDPASSPHSPAPPEAQPIVDGEPSDLQMLSPQPQLTPAPTPSGPELKIFLFGFPTIFKWSIVNKLVQKVAHGAGVTIDADLETFQGSVRRLTVSGSFVHDPAFPRTITVFDRTLRSRDTTDDPALIYSHGVRPLAIVFIPCPPLGLPEHVLHLPIVLPSCPSELLEFANIGASSSRTTSDLIDIPNQQILRLNGPVGSPMIEQDSIDTMDAPRTYRAFSRLWSGDNVSRGMMASTHALTIIAILSLILGLIVRATLPVSLQQFASPTLPTLPVNCTSCSLWQMIRPAPYRERLPASTTLDSSVVAIPSSLKDSSLSVFSVESTSITLSRANPTGLRRVTPPVLSERPKVSKELMLQPPCSVLPTDNRPKALAVIPETSPSISRPPVSDATAHAVSTLRHASVPDVVKGCASVVLTIMNQDMQDIFDALDALVQAISRQTQMILTQATTFIEQSSVYMEMSVESFEAVKGTLRAHNERAKRRAKEIKEKGAKWLFDASEAVTTSARFSTGMAWELAEGLAYRAERARGKAKEMAAELQDILNEGESLGVLGAAAWDSHMKYWDEWMEKAIKQEKKFCKRNLKSSILC